VTFFPFALSNGAAKKIIAAYAAIFHHDVQLGAKFIEVYQSEEPALKRNLLPFFLRRWVKTCSRELREQTYKRHPRPRFSVSSCNRKSF